MSKGTLQSGQRKISTFGKWTDIFLTIENAQVWFKCRGWEKYKKITENDNNKN